MGLLQQRAGSSWASKDVELFVPGSLRCRNTTKRAHGKLQAGALLAVLTTMGISNRKVSGAWRPILACLLLCCVIGCEERPEDWPRERFESGRWKALPPESRFVMVNDLIASKILMGRSKQSVITLLGPPSFAASDGSYVTYVVKDVPANVRSFNFIRLLHIWAYPGFVDTLILGQATTA
jgi:hypothetical protein